jgi:glycosyltransferase involved in cell wall biosynthesis
VPGDNPSTTVVLVAGSEAGPAGLERSLGSVLGQAMDEPDDLEVLVVGDGVDDEIRVVASRLAAADDRVRFFDNPKGAGDGEAHLVRALAEARGETIGYLTAGDLWLPDHVATVRELLSDTEFVHTVALAVRPSGELGTALLDLGDLRDRRLVLRGENRIVLSTVAHASDAYRKLPLGWQTSPGASGPLSFCQQWLAEPWVRARSGTRPTVISFPPEPIVGAPADIGLWADRAAEAAWREHELPWLMFDAARASWRETDRELRRITESAPWQTGLRWVKRVRKVQARLQKYR